MFYSQRKTAFENVAAIQAQIDGATALFEQNVQTKIAQLLTENNAITTTSIPAENDRLVNSIYLRKWQQDVAEMSEGDLITLQTIAIQCPQTGGDGVYRARAIYAQYHPEAVFEDLECESVEFRRNQNPIDQLNVDFILKPNPANTSVQMDFIKNYDFAGDIRVVNTFGQSVATIEKSIDSNLITLDLQNIPSGVYFVQLWKGDSLVKSQKLSVVK